MVLTESLNNGINEKAHDFSLQSVDGFYYSPYKFFQGGKCYLLAFICNHCPYVTSKIDLFLQTVTSLDSDFSCKTIAILSNDSTHYPEDSYENMKLFSDKNKFTFPYVWDNTQEVAKAYDVLCTPEFFLLDKDLLIRYHGRLSEPNKNPDPRETELYNAAKAISNGLSISHSYPSIGCSIKWKK